MFGWDHEGVTWGVKTAVKAFKNQVGARPRGKKVIRDRGVSTLSTKVGCAVVLGDRRTSMGRDSLHHYII